MKRAEKLEIAIEGLDLLVRRLPGSLEASVFHYDMLMRSIVLLATDMRDATMENTPAKRARATAMAFRRANNILRKGSLLSSARPTKSTVRAPTAGETDER